MVVVILDNLLDAFEAVVMWVAGLFPIFDLGASFESTSLVFEYAADLNYFLPISEVTTVVFAALMVFPLLMGTTLLIWCIALVRGGSARG